MITAIDNDAQAECLRPSDGPPELTFVLFIDPGEPMCDKAIDKLRAMTWRGDLRIAVVDVHRAPQTARWFGVHTGPALAAVYDAALLAIEHECSEEAFARLIAAAREQMDLMDWV